MSLPSKLTDRYCDEVAEPRKPAFVIPSVNIVKEVSGTEARPDAELPAPEIGPVAQS